MILLYIYPLVVTRIIIIIFILINIIIFTIMWALTTLWFYRRLRSSHIQFYVSIYYIDSILTCECNIRYLFSPYIGGDVCTIDAIMGARVVLYTSIKVNKLLRRGQFLSSLSKHSALVTSYLMKIILFV